MTEISPAILTTIQNDFVNKLSGAFLSATGFAQNLFYILAVIEIVLFGLLWAFRQEQAIGQLLLKLIRLGIIFWIITAYPHILQAFIDGFTKVGFHISGAKTNHYFFDPATIWQFGFNAGIAMLKVAVTYGKANLSMGLIYIILGFGTLMLFGFIGAQIIFLVASFYIVSLLALILIPFGALAVTQKLFYRAIQGVMKIGAAIFALLIVLGVGVMVWSHMGNIEVTQSTSLNVPLGLFFATLVFTVLTWRIPNLAMSVVGSFGGDLWPSANASADTSVSVSTSVNASQAAVATPVASAGPNAIAAATTISPGASVGPASTSPTASAANVSVSSQNTTPSSSSTATSSGLFGSNDSVGKGAGLSKENMNQLKQTIRQTMKDNQRTPKNK